MARSAQLAMRGFGGRVRFWGDVLSGVKYRVFEALGALLVLASLLLVLALLTYFPGDASFDTAVAAPPRNYLGYDGAVIADPDFGGAIHRCRGHLPNLPNQASFFDHKSPATTL